MRLNNSKKSCKRNKRLISCIYDKTQKTSGLCSRSASSLCFLSFGVCSLVLSFLEALVYSLFLVVIQSELCPSFTIRLPPDIWILHNLRPQITELQPCSHHDFWKFSWALPGISLFLMLCHLKPWRYPAPMILFTVDDGIFNFTLRNYSEMTPQFIDCCTSTYLYFSETLPL